MLTVPNIDRQKPPFHRNDLRGHATHAMVDVVVALPGDDAVPLLSQSPVLISFVFRNPYSVRLEGGEQARRTPCFRSSWF